jgi:predicted nuclease of restriction endonuclease-like (RecB) superfamily
VKRKRIPQPPVPLPSPSPAQVGAAELAGYGELLEELKSRIRAAQVRAALAVNREMITLYWDIGRAITQRQDREGWGTSVIDQLATDLQAAFPGVQGFSTRNLWRMRAFYRAHSQEVVNLPQAVAEIRGAILPQAVAELPGTNLPQVVAEFSEPASSPAVAEQPGSNLPQAVAEIPEPILPQAVAEIPWGHNIVLVEKIKDPAERLWYARRTVEHGWSRNTLVHQIEGGLYRRQGQATTNFDRTLPAAQSDLASELLKDPYHFDFLTLGLAVQERDLERALLAHVRDFLLELGVGFALVGSQYPLQVAGQDYHVDLLFYHIRLRCYVAVELKVGAFQPEYAGKMNFYLAVIDERLRDEGQQPSIGLILCKERNRVVAEYALRGTSQPIGVAEYRLTEELPQRLRGSLPTAETLEKELAQVGDRIAAPD